MSTILYLRNTNEDVRFLEKQMQLLKRFKKHTGLKIELNDNLQEPVLVWGKKIVAKGTKNIKQNINDYLESQSQATPTKIRQQQLQQNHKTMSMTEDKPPMAAKFDSGAKSVASLGETAFDPNKTLSVIDKLHSLVPAGSGGGGGGPSKVDATAKGAPGSNMNEIQMLLGGSLQVPGVMGSGSNGGIGSSSGGGMF